MRNKNLFRSSRLYLQLSVIFVMILVVFAAFAIYISVRSAQQYAVEVNQQLNWALAENTVAVIKPQFRNGTVNKEAVQDIMHSMMAMNPSVEVYLLDPYGNILSYVAPEKTVKLRRVSLSPILQFLAGRDKKLIFGDDPRNPGEKKVFSASRVMEGKQLSGYIYIVLASQE